MAYCSNCGAKVVDEANFCQKCGHSLQQNPVAKPTNQRQQIYEGQIYKCPNCGEPLKSFTRNCPICGFEIRSVNHHSAVKEFARKLESINFINPVKGLFSGILTQSPKASFIQNFSVPNTKEDMLEFMILATSNIDYENLDGVGEKKQIADAWIAKSEQIYEKAKSSYGNDADFIRIEELYQKRNEFISKAKKKKNVEIVKDLAGFAIFFIIIFGLLLIVINNQNKNEENRLEAIVVDIEKALDNGDYKIALMNAESMNYNLDDKERKRWWEIKREALIDKIIESAEKEGIFLERTVKPTETLVVPNNDKKSGNPIISGFIDGIKEGIQPGLETMESNIDEFNRIMNNLTPSPIGN